jgi:hypothetical protein
LGLTIVVDRHFRSLIALDMASAPLPPAEDWKHSAVRASNADLNEAEGADLLALWRQIRRGAGQIVGFGLLGLSCAVVAHFAVGLFSSVDTSARVTFSFPGLEHGEYPDQSKFQPDDLIAPAIVAEAIQQQEITGAVDFTAAIRAGLSIQGVIPLEVSKSRTSLVAGGQILPPYVPSEYTLTLSLPKNFPLTERQRELLINAIVNAYRKNFASTYAEVPHTLGNAFVTLNNADFFDYELILNKEIENISDYLSRKAEKFPTFRSQTTHLTFSDLLEQIQLFSQVHVNATLGLIYVNGLSRDRNSAMLKMDYYLQTLDDKENRAKDEEAVVQDLLAKSQIRTDNYVLGIKTAAADHHSDAPLIDQGLIDSLLANDAYNFLVRRALTAGLKVTDLAADKVELEERRKRMEIFTKGSSSDQSAVYIQVQKSLDQMKTAYDQFISDLRQTDSDFEHQQFADAIRISSNFQTEGTEPFLRLMEVAAMGLLLGIAVGVGLSLLGINFGSSDSRQCGST